MIYELQCWFKRPNGQRACMMSVNTCRDQRAIQYVWYGPRAPTHIHGQDFHKLTPNILYEISVIIILRLLLHTSASRTSSQACKYTRTRACGPAGRSSADACGWHHAWSSAGSGNRPRKVVHLYNQATVHVTQVNGLTEFATIDTETDFGPQVTASTNHARWRPSRN